MISDTTPVTTSRLELVLVPKAPDILRVLIYARISKLRRGNSENTAIQVAECMREAKYLASSRDKRLVIVVIFQEDDKGASKQSKKPRPLWDRTLELIRGNWVDVLMGTEIERLTHQPDEISDIIKLAASGNDIDEIYLTSDMGFDLSTDEGIYRAREAVNRSERETNKLSTRQKRKIAARAEKGYSQGGRRQLAFKIGNNELDEESEELVTLREMARRRIAGHSQYEIADWLNRGGRPTSGGGLWSHDQVGETLRRKAYAPHPDNPERGIRAYKGVQYVAVWKPAFDADTWAQLQLIDRMNAAKYRNRPKGGKRYPWTGFLYCGGCALPLSGETKRDKPEKPLRRVYACKARSATGERRGCGGVVCGAEPLEDYLLSSLFYRLDTPELGKLLAGDNPDDGKLKELLGQREHQERRIREILDDYADGNITKADKGYMHTRAQQKLAAIDTQIDELNRARTASGLLPVGQNIREAWEANDSVTWERELFGLMIERVIIKPGGGKPIYRGQLVDATWKFDPERVEIRYKA